MRLRERPAYSAAIADDPKAVPPRAHIQVVERIPRMERVHELPRSSGFPTASAPASAWWRGGRSGRAQAAVGEAVTPTEISAVRLSRHGAIRTACPVRHPT